MAFVWLKESDWEDGEKADFCRLRQVPPAVIYQPLPYFKPGKRGAPYRLGRWLFQDLKRQPWAFVEVEGHVANFSMLTVLISPCSLPGGWEHALARDGLSLLISGLFIMTKSDLVTLVPTSRRVEAELACLGIGDARNLWSPTLQTARLLSPEAGLKIQTRDIAAAAWWERAKADQKTLAYLIKRRDAEEAQAQPKRKKPPGLLGRLNRLLRWS